MECLLEPAASEVQVVPVQGTARSRGDGETQQGEDRGPARHHVVEVEEDRRNRYVDYVKIYS